MGQLTHTNNDCNDNFKVVLSQWRKTYGKLVPGNRLPVFFDIEQSANVLLLASWGLVADKGETSSNSDGIVDVDSSAAADKSYVGFRCAKNPLHILSTERVGTTLEEYNWTKYGDIEDEIGKTDWLFDAYHYCPADGSLLIPLYNFDCQEAQTSVYEEKEESEFNQTAIVKMFVIPAQTLKTDNYVANSKIRMLKDVRIDLNKEVKLSEDKTKFRFDHPVKVCRNTNLVFSPYDCNGMNKVRCAFLGVFDSGMEDSKFKVSSTTAKTRYEFDSKSASDLSLLKRRYYKNETYVDEGILRDGFNSYDSNDKYVLTLDFEPSIDNPSLFDLSIDDGISASAYNILVDAGYIPHFAYQSLVRYAEGDDGGTAYTWQNKHLKDKEHMQFELLGLDDKGIPDVYAAMQKMVVKDLTDDCETILRPAKLMEDIFRIWC